MQQNNLDHGAKSDESPDSANKSKLARADFAVQFYEELTQEVESFVLLVELYGELTLADIVYLQAAILKGTCIENSPGKSFIVDVVKALPSSKTWLNHIINTGE